ncbi:MAG: long-chain-acyl-CoA synthetase [Pseudomonadota bacterium]|nr:long-chain-acyl-CoA synthetase [Pseudomonadota bacterium]
MGWPARLKREWRYLSGLGRTLARVGSIRPTSKHLICDDLEAAVDLWRARAALCFEGATLTYGEMDALANRCAHWALGEGLGQGDSVAVLLPNRLEYLPLWYGFTKAGVAAALINSLLTGAALAHCLNIAGAGHCIVDAQTQGALESARVLLDRPIEAWSLSDPHGGQASFTKALERLSGERPARAGRAGLTAADTALYIYTSGTTGLPKAARITHMRAQLFMRGFAGATGARPTDRLYLALPLYHSTGGLCAMGAALLNGASVTLKSEFSASRFWGDMVAEGATLFVYIGELCRYLAAQPPHPLERAHRLRLAFGNGLSPDVWLTFETRFGVSRILEFYGSTEGNVSMFNFDGTLGAIGRAPNYLGDLFNAALARFDVEVGAPVRGADGLCVKAAPGEVGECLGRIGDGARTAYSGYVDREASEGKVLHDVFRRGDRWFRTGDLMTRDKDGCFYFVDRVGDTFRWKGENVSTTEVAQRLAVAPGVADATVYGVKVGRLDGRAGMAALVAEPDFDLAAFGRYASAALPPYAQPLFLRLVATLETTGTFKHRKMDLVADGFDPGKIGAGLYFRDRILGFVPLTQTLYEKIVSGEERL